MPLKEVGLYVMYLIHKTDDSTITEDWTTRDDVEGLRNSLVGWEPR